MNANELADELDYCYGKEYPCPVSKEAATMLRQQQAEIEVLKAGKIRAYDNGVEDGRKPNTNPVKDKPHPKCDEACMYLCQMRELTDEEIQQVLNDFDWFVKFVNPFDFARAILRKAQEK